MWLCIYSVYLYIIIYIYIICVWYFSDGLVNHQLVSIETYRGEYSLNDLYKSPWLQKDSPSITRQLETRFVISTNRSTARDILRIGTLEFAILMIFVVHGRYVGLPCLVDADCFTKCRKPALASLQAGGVELQLDGWRNLEPPKSP